MNGPRRQGPEAIKAAITATFFVAIAAVLGSILSFAGMLLYFAAIPFFVATRRYGFVFVLPFAFVAYVFVGVYISFIGALFDVMAPVMAALVMGELSRLNRSQPEVLAKGITVSLMANLAGFACQYFVSGEPMVEMMRAFMNEMRVQQQGPGELTLSMAQMSQESFELMLKAVPAILFLWAIVVVLLTYYIGCGYLIKKGMVIEKYRSFKGFTFPRNLIFGMLFLYLLAFLAGYVRLVDSEAMNLNLMIVAWFLFTVQGFAVLKFFAEKIKMSKVLFVMAILLLSISVLGLMGVTLLGMLDLMFRFRARVAQE